MPDSFQDLPFYYLEIAGLLFKLAPDSFGDELYKVDLGKRVTAAWGVGAASGSKADHFKQLCPTNLSMPHTERGITLKLNESSLIRYTCPVSPWAV